MSEKIIFTETTNLFDLDRRVKGILSKHNYRLPFFNVNGRCFAEGAYVVGKNGIIRVITEKKDDEYFLDDGTISACAPSPYCHFKDYQMI